MRSLSIIVLTALVAAPAFAKPPREELPAPKELVGQVGEGNSDAEIARVTAAAAAFPLGTSDNPVRTSGPNGSRAYLTRLRCADGSIPAIGTRTPAGVGAYGTVVDAWALDCGKAEPGQVSLIVDMYHDGHEEAAAPPGFTIQPR